MHAIAVTATASHPFTVMRLNPVPLLDEFSPKGTAEFNILFATLA
jgi:hypothetical protein